MKVISSDPNFQASKNLWYLYSPKRKIKLFCDEYWINYEDILLNIEIDSKNIHPISLDNIQIDFSDSKETRIKQMKFISINKKRINQSISLMYPEEYKEYRKNKKAAKALASKQ